MYLQPWISKEAKQLGRCFTRVMKVSLCTGMLLAPWTGIAANASIDTIQSIIDEHLARYKDVEHFSAIQVSVKSGGLIQNYVSGTVARGKNQTLLAPHHLFNIGSITKSFTAVLALQAQKRQQLNLNEKVKTYLPQYSHWGDITLEQLLNMTSGLPNYSDSASMNIAFSKNLGKVWTSKEMLALVYKNDYKPPLQQGYNYTNTGYILMQMILQKQTKHSFADLLEKEIFIPVQLSNSFYPVPIPGKSISQRLVSGYGYNVYTNPELLGRDVKENNLSWAGAAGGIVANSEDVLHWVEALFQRDMLLDAAQKNKMQRLVSTTTGKPIQLADKNDTRGFGLGIIESYRPDIGRYWFYEGETLGYRALYMYVPSSKIIITALFNSATNGANDHSGALLESLYKDLKGKP